MSVVIDGTTGISGNDGSAGTPALRGDDANTGVFFPAADVVALATGGSERLRVASAGQIGIGGANYGTSGQVLVSGGAGAAPSWTTAPAPASLSTASGSAPSFSARAWVNFDGFSGAIRGSGNVSSVTYNGTGQSTVNFATAMQDTNYSAVCSAHSAGYNRQSNGFPYYLGYSAGSIIIWTGNTINAVADNMSHVNVVVFR